MGREQICQARVGAEAAEVKALLETSELILRGGLRRRYPLAQLQQLQVAGDALHFQAAGEAVQLQLGAAEAQRWLAKIHRPPPTLAAKLGVSAQQPAWVHGPLDDAALAQALHGATTRNPAAAQLMLAVVGSAAALDAALQVHAALPCRALWLVHAKGPHAPLGDSAIRSTLRACGYVDNKTTAVSEVHTATRYVRR